MNTGKLEEAAFLFSENVQENPHFKDLELLGECFMQLGRLREAVVLLAAATTFNDGVRAPALLAEVFLMLGEIEDAARTAKLALTRDSQNRMALEVRRSTAKI